MALVERLMGLTDAGAVPPEGSGYNLKIPVHGFGAASCEIIAGGLTVAQLKALVWVPGAPAMRIPQGDQAELDAIIALAPGAGNPAARALFVQRIEGILELGELRIAGYETPAAIRAKIGI